jgi:alkaline phosphatase
MGGGNPDFDDNGRALKANEKRDYSFVGGEQTWKALKAGQRDWQLIQSKADFEALTSGPAPAKVVGVPQIGKTCQEKRGRLKGSTVEPFATPLNSNVPSLATMTQAAINCLDTNPKGFYLMIEGGAVDWANHANDPDRMIEEQIDYVKAVEAVVAWVETHGGWDDTLLILTADHETGFIWGPDSSKVAFQPLQDNGPGKMPGLAYHSHGHSNSLVPLYVRGPGSERFAALVNGTDKTAAEKWQFSGQYVNNTDIFAVMQAEVREKDKK